MTATRKNWIWFENMHTQWMAGMKGQPPAIMATSLINALDKKDQDMIFRELREVRAEFLCELVCQGGRRRALGGDFTTYQLRA